MSLMSRFAFFTCLGERQVLIFPYNPPFTAGSQRTRRKRRAIWGYLYLPLALLLVLPGCGGDWGTVKGKVTLDEKPLAKAQVTLNPVIPGAAAYGTADATGLFSLNTGDRPGLKAGDYIATVTLMSIPLESSGKAVSLLTPAKYATTDKSELRVTIAAGENPVMLKLTSK